MSDKGFGNGKATPDSGYGLFLTMPEYRPADKTNIMLWIYFRSGERSFVNQISRFRNIRIHIEMERAMRYDIELPFSSEQLKKIQPGDILSLNGTVYTARDAAHKRMYEALERGEELPFDIKNAVIYYLGPTPAREGQVIGSAGPTTSGRMDKYTPALLKKGLRGMIGKGRRSEEVRKSIAENNSIYMGATGGAGALLSKCIISSEIIAYEDLGTEAIRKLEVKDFPVTVLISADGTVFTV